MILNKTSYTHKQIRLACYILEQETGMTLKTDLSQEFQILKFEGKLSYLTIDYKKQVCFAMSHKLTKTEMELIDTIVVYIQWLEIENEYRKRHQKGSRTSRKLKPTIKKKQ